LAFFDNPVELIFWGESLITAFLDILKLNASKIAQKRNTALYKRALAVVITAPYSGQLMDELFSLDEPWTFV
jgi:hypothetical protein